jgi:hypothetical protein
MCRVPNMVLMQYISAFFSGFILSKFFRYHLGSANDSPIAFSFDTGIQIATRT